MSIQIPWAPGAQFIHVVCRLGEPRPDAGDSDAYPDLMTQGGTVTLTCNAPRIRYSEADGRARMLTMKTWNYGIRVTDGELYSPVNGEVGVDILSGLSTGLDPSEFTWTAVVTPADGQSWSVVIPSNATGTVDLVKLGDSVVASQGMSTKYVRFINNMSPDQDGNININTNFTLDPEVIDDRVAVLLKAGANITLTYSDELNQIEVSAADQQIDWEAVDDHIAGLLVGSNNLTVTYDDLNNTIKLDALGWEAIEDRIAGMLQAGNNVTLVYNDDLGTIQVSSTVSGGGGPKVQRYAIAADTNLDTSTWSQDYPVYAVFTMDSVGSWAVNLNGNRLPLNYGSTQITSMMFIYNGSAWDYIVLTPGY